MLVASYLIETKSYPTTAQLAVLERYFKVGTNTQRRYFKANLVAGDAEVLRGLEWIKSVSENVEGTSCS